MPWDSLPDIADTDEETDTDLVRVRKLLKGLGLDTDADRQIDEFLSLMYRDAGAPNPKA